MSDTDEQCGVIKNDGDPCTFKAKYDDGKCGIHTDEKDTVGRPSDVEKHKETILQYARDGMSVKDCANIAGVDKSNLYRYMDRNPSFRNEFKRAQAAGSHELRRMLLNPQEDENAQGARFLLERSRGYTKTEDKNVDLSGDLTIDTEFVTIGEDGEIDE